MFEKLPVIKNSEQLIDQAFKATKKVMVSDRDAYYKKKKTVIKKIDVFSKNIISNLESYVKQFPNFDEVSSFYQEIINIKLDMNILKKSLGGVHWAQKTCLMIYTKQSKFLKKSGNIDFLLKKQQEIYGRMTSVVKQVDKELRFLSDAQRFLKKLPLIEDINTIVIAGYPNVGKSSILKCISSAKPQIAQYPFTTKEISVGHIEKMQKYERTRYQIIDTPGLLDRPFEKRNDIEKQAIAALRYLADIILFVLDPSETCGYSLKEQKNLLTELKKMFKEQTFIIIENKSDIKKSKTKNLKISCIKDVDTKKLMEKIYSIELKK